MDLPRLLAAGDLPTLSRAVRKIKGSAGSIGASYLACICSELEHAAKVEEAERSRLRVSGALAAIEQLLLSLGQLIPPA